MQDLEVKLDTDGESVYKNSLAIWGNGKKWGEVKLAYEMIPFVKSAGRKAKPEKIKLDYELVPYGN